MTRSANPKAWTGWRADAARRPRLRGHRVFRAMNRPPATARCRARTAGLRRPASCRPRWIGARRRSVGNSRWRGAPRNCSGPTMPAGRGSRASSCRTAADRAPTSPKWRCRPTAWLSSTGRYGNGACSTRAISHRPGQPGRQRPDFVYSVDEQCQPRATALQPGPDRTRATAPAVGPGAQIDALLASGEVRESGARSHLLAGRAARRRSGLLIVVQSYSENSTSAFTTSAR